LNDAENLEIKKMANVMMNSEKGEHSLVLGGKKYIVVYRNLVGSKWTLGVVIPEYSLFSSIRHTKKLVAKTINKIILQVVLITILLIMLFITCNLIFFRKSLLNPLVNLCNDTRKLISSNFTIIIKHNKIFEINTLGTALNSLGVKLKEYIKVFKKEIETRQIIETEINIATDIQKSLLPKVTREFLVNQFDIFADIYLVKNASKCFYDFFYINDDTLVMVVADVSEKGVPAAFYIGMLKTLLKNICLREKNDDPAKVLDEVNKLINSVDNNLSIYTNIFLLYYKFKSGEFLYTNTGKTVGGYMISGSDLTRLEKTGNIALGVSENSDYFFRKTVLINRDKIILFARDFVENIDTGCLAEKRTHLENLLMNYNNLTCKKICSNLVDELKILQSEYEIDAAAILVLERVTPVNGKIK
jgi:phosphoserine phosphatase RsbU/P